MTKELRFEVNFSYNATIMTKSLGSGLGLTIVQAIIERYRGHITVKNLEQGARFSISLYPVGS